MNFLIFFYFFTFSAYFSEIDIFHRSQFLALRNNRNEFSRGQRERGREGGRGSEEREGKGGREGERKGRREREEQVAQGQYVVSDTRCPALCECELE